MPSDFTQDVIKIIKNIPVGKVLTYGKIAKLAGNPRGARQVSWLLHSSSNKYNLPWHRVINSQGKIVLKAEDGKEFQKILLEKEGIEIVGENKVDLKKYLWEIDSLSNI
ncbi:MAG: MGMT family protein [Candidatus Lokiarchaeota archaeon]|nr:MGMT family protein [Candidatus Lokiarchaeota archaeon]